MLVVAFLLLAHGGCRNWEWTDFEYFNRSNSDIHVDVTGVSPDPSPGYLVADVVSSGRLMAASHFGETVVFDDVIKVAWSVESSTGKREAAFRREALGIPESVSGGTIRFTYTEKEQWKVEFLKP